MTPILGIDISSNNWRRGLPFAMLPYLKKAGVQFVIARASIGTVPDPAFQATVNRVRAKGWLAGAYHYLVDGVDVQAQVDIFAKQIKSVGADNLLTVLDVERGGRPTYQEAVAFSNGFNAAIPKHDLIVYTNRSTWGSFGNPDISAHFDALWQALYLVSHQTPMPSLPVAPPRGFGGEKAPLWQWGPYVIKGHALDGDAYYGPLSNLQALAQSHVKPPKPDTSRTPYIDGNNETTVALMKLVRQYQPPGTPGPFWQQGVDDAKDNAIADLTNNIILKETP